MDDWDFASEDQRAAFYQKYCGARGPALAAAVQLHVEELKRARNDDERKERKRVCKKMHRCRQRALRPREVVSDEPSKLAFHFESKTPSAVELPSARKVAKVSFTIERGIIV